jgi:acetate---CoA ligase (ADP-forming) subunit beta
MDLIDNALTAGRSVLLEHEAKKLLAAHGIPVTREGFAEDPAAAVDLAMKIGFPVVLKAAGSRLHHKTEVSGVALYLRSTDDVMKEGARLLQIDGCEGLLVQEMVKGERELVCGLTSDEQFGPCVLFGIGGVLTEVIHDMVFRLAPLTQLEARTMVTEIRGRKILDPFRGEAAADLDGLCRILVTLGEMGGRHKEIAAIDINPLKIRPDGALVAVDALVALRVPKTDKGFSPR